MNCKGIKCQNVFCDKCWISYPINNKIKCDNYDKCGSKLCLDCSNTSNCDKCGNKICCDCNKHCDFKDECKTNYCQECLMNIMIADHCNNCDGIICNDCYDRNKTTKLLDKCYNCDQVHCNKCYTRQCEHVCNVCNDQKYECSSIGCNNVICIKCGNDKWFHCKGCQYFYGQRYIEIMNIFCNFCVDKSCKQCRKCKYRYCISCNKAVGYDCIGCSLQKNKKHCK